MSVIGTATVKGTEIGTEVEIEIAIETGKGGGAVLLRGGPGPLRLIGTGIEERETGKLREM